MSDWKGKKASNSLQPELISKDRRHKVERVAESEIVPSRHVFLSTFWTRNCGERGEVVKVGIVLLILLIFKIDLSTTK